MPGCCGLAVWRWFGGARPGTSTAAGHRQTKPVHPNFELFKMCATAQPENCRFEQTNKISNLKSMQAKKQTNKQAKSQTSKASKQRNKQKTNNNQNKATKTLNGLAVWRWFGGARLLWFGGLAAVWRWFGGARPGHQHSSRAPPNQARSSNFRTFQNVRDRSTRKL